MSLSTYANHSSLFSTDPLAPLANLTEVSLARLAEATGFVGFDAAAEPERQATGSAACKL